MDQSRKSVELGSCEPDAEEAAAHAVYVRWLGVMITLGALSLFTCVTIEVLNLMAGSIMPKTETGKWRAWIPTSEHLWRDMESQMRSDLSLTTRPLTAVESRQMWSEISRNRANNRLRDFVGSFGLLQYIVLPTLGWLSIRGWRDPNLRSRRHVAAAGILIVAVCSLSLLYRSYFTSLGW